MEQQSEQESTSPSGPPPSTTTTTQSESGPPKKRIRKSRSRGLRTKNGCLTCRGRHKKCDEQLPVCGPCTISSRECVYAAGAKPSSVTASKLSPVSASKSPVEIRTKSEADAPSATSAEVSTHPPATQSIYSTSIEQSVDAPLGQSLAVRESFQYGYSPQTVASELWTADLASTRWLDLLATDAAQADSTFSLAPSPAPEDAADRYDASQTPAAANPADVEKHAWQLDRDIVLQNHEAVLFRNFAERAALWLDVFEPQKHFSTHATQLALRNLGLMKAILALAARHQAMTQAMGDLSDPSESIQYYYETLHYVQTALQYNTYAHSEELLATAIVISTYEMLNASDSNWQRHLKGVFWIQRSQDVNGGSGGLRQSVWWTWLRQDIWAAFREKRACLSFWRPIKDYPELNQDQLALRAVYLLSQSVNYCADPDAASSDPQTIARRNESGEVLLEMLERWKSFLGPKFKPLPTPCQPTDAEFTPLWIHPPEYGLAMQVYSFARILITLHRPPVAGFDGYLKTQRTLSDAVSTICGIAMELKDEGCQIMSAQCLFGAGLCVQEEPKRNAIISMIDACEERTGWPMGALRNDLRAEWAKAR